MVDSPDLVLGLVTHPRSRFRESGQRTIDAVSEALRESGVRFEVVISDRNDADPVHSRIDRALIARSARHQASLEARWRKHLDHRWGGPLGDIALTWSMAARRTSASPEDLMRLLNIDLSHLRIWRTALTQGAQAALVLEDDAQLRTDVIGAIVAELVPLSTQQCVLINCSTSIDPTALGVQNLLENAPTTSLLPGHVLRQPQRAVTNTVCANLYSAEFLAQLISFIDRRGLVPVAPIDWRVNEFLLENPEAQTWWLDPPPFQQGSMHG